MTSWHAYFKDWHQGWTSLLFPTLQASKGYPGLITSLLEHGARLGTKDMTGSTALHRAASSGTASSFIHSFFKNLSHKKARRWYCQTISRRCFNFQFPGGCTARSSFKRTTSLKHVYIWCMLVYGELAVFWHTFIHLHTVSMHACGWYTCIRTWSMFLCVYSGAFLRHSVAHLDPFVVVS